MELVLATALPALNVDVVSMIANFFRLEDWICASGVRILLPFDKYCVKHSVDFLRIDCKMENLDPVVFLSWDNDTTWQRVVLNRTLYEELEPLTKNAEICHCRLRYLNAAVNAALTTSKTFM
jgi:hypothetical protein